MSDGEQPPIIFQMTPTRRILMVSLIILEHISFLWGTLLFFRYQFGFNIYIVDYPTLADERPPSPDEDKLGNHLWNAGLYLCFWLQHIGMATLAYKIKLQKWGSTFPLYERYIYNILSGLTFWAIFAHVQPRYEYLFDIPKYVWLPLTIIGIGLQLASTVQLGDTMLMPFTLSAIMNEKTVSFTPYTQKFRDGLYTKGLYAWMRNPMQTGVFLYVMTSTGHYTIDKLIFCAVMGSGIYIGVLMEEKRMTRLFVTYKEYMGKVKTRLLPFLL